MSEEKSWSLSNPSTPVEIINLRGSIKITQNTSDRIWARISKTGHLTSENSVSKVQSVLGSQEMKWSQEASAARLSVSYREGFSIHDKLQFNQPVYRADLEVSVPVGARIKVFAKSGEILINHVRFSQAELKMDTGGVRVSNSIGNTLSIGLKKGNADLKNVLASVDVNLGKGEIEISEVSGGALSITQNTGKTALNGLHFKNVALKAKEVDFNLNGVVSSISLISQSGSFKGLELDGELFLSGDYLNIDVDWTTWSSVWESTIESRYGKIQLKLPQDFEGELNLLSEQGVVSSEGITIEQNQFLKFSEHKSSSHELQGFVRHRLRKLWIRSITGAILVSKKNS